MEHIKLKISCFRVCLEKGHLSLIFHPGKKYRVFGEEIPPPQVVQERTCPSATNFFGKTTSFSGRLEKENMVFRAVLGLTSWEIGKDKMYMSN